MERLQNEPQNFEYGYIGMAGKSSSEMAGLVEVKPKRRLNYQKKFGELSSSLNFGMNLYSGIASMNLALESSTMAIPGLKKFRLSDNLDGRPPRGGFDLTQ